VTLFDLHTDILTDIAIRREAGERSVFDSRHYPILKRNQIDSLICVIWVEPKYRENKLDRFNELVSHTLADFNESEHVHLCTSSLDMKQNRDKINIFLGIEGMSFLKEAVTPLTKDTTSIYFDKLHQLGFRTGILTWNEINDLASGSAAYNADKQIAKGLTSTGKLVVQKMMELRWLIDVSHLDERTFWDIYHLNEYPIFASHSNAKALCNHDRNLTDQQLKAIAERNGLIGLNAYAGFLNKGQASIDDYINHIEYIANLIGLEHVALGFDFMNYLEPHDVGTSFSKPTDKLKSADDVQGLISRLKRRNWDQKAIQMIMADNANHFMKNMDRG